MRYGNSKECWHYKLLNSFLQYFFVKLLAANYHQHLYRLPQQYCCGLAPTVLLWACLNRIVVGLSQQNCCGLVPTELLWACPNSIVVGLSQQNCCGLVPTELLWACPNRIVGGFALQSFAPEAPKYFHCNPGYLISSTLLSIYYKPGKTTF